MSGPFLPERSRRCRIAAVMSGFSFGDSRTAWCSSMPLAGLRPPLELEFGMVASGPGVPPNSAGQRARKWSREIFADFSALVLAASVG